jgi:hypothetical protein
MPKATSIYVRSKVSFTHYGCRKAYRKATDCRDPISKRNNIAELEVAVFLSFNRATNAAKSSIVRAATRQLVAFSSGKRQPMRQLQLVALQATLSKVYLREDPYTKGGCCCCCRSNFRLGGVFSDCAERGRFSRPGKLWQFRSQHSRIETGAKEGSVHICSYGRHQEYRNLRAALRRAEKIPSRRGTTG